jgi:hypothetical protein
MADPPRSLLNVFEVEMDGRTRHLVCFLDNEEEWEEGIEERWVVGECTPGPDDSFEVSSFSPNPAFIEAFAAYMNAEASRAPEMTAQARENPSGWLYLVDPRISQNSTAEPPPTDLVGCFAIDNHGQIVPDSFQYNRKHLWFDSISGPSGVFADKRFYDWLHQATGG